MIFSNELLVQLIFVSLHSIFYHMNTRFILLFIFVASISSVCVAQLPPPPPPPEDEPGCWPPPCIPIDGGISLLIAAGAIYGGKKLYSKQKEKKSL